MLKFVQVCIMIAVIGSNGQYHWTPNPYVPVAFGICAALLFTILWTWLRWGIQGLRVALKQSSN